LFRDRKGKIPVQDYLFGITDEKEFIQAIQVIQRLAVIGQAILDTDMAKHIERPIYELRPARHRIMYMQDGDHFVLLSAFLKKTQKTPPSEIEIAKRNYAEYKKNGEYIGFDIPPM
jgi:phage-related protein